ncbi:YeeE/YedE family protein [Sulfuriflexus mobilis]|uniref:YeeE/YedE family protein n=1 Tax=Sulfuriflexus mobilis TaxID=1811807 RepID=UPI000F833B25|nr:YeeE/YedE family protein [Sulfuriflexus mobilis]
MLFEDFASAQSALLWSTFVIALIMGAVVNKTNFCTMGAVSDIVNIGDNGRMRAWLFAVAVAMIGVAIFEATGMASVDASFPPYRSSTLIWAENLLGGIMFGVGMTFGSGCGNKTLVRIGGGNIKSVFVLLVIGVIAYFMVNPFPGTDITLMSALFYDWIRPLAINLTGPQDLGSLIGGENAAQMRTWLGLGLGLLLAIYAFRSTEFRKSFDNILAGVVVGGAILAAWYLTANMAVTLDGETHSLRAIVENWSFVTDDAPGKPAAAAPWSTQSFTFINPMGQTLGYTASGFNYGLLTFGVMALLGVISGSFLWAVVSKGFRIEWFANFKDFLMHLLGGVLMGFGGVLAVGCTIGQAVTGTSTLAVGSMIAFAGIVFGSAMTMKIQYYKLVYEEEASFAKALISSLCDLRMLPNGLRKLDAV